jgi:protein Mpv17
MKVCVLFMTIAVATAYALAPHTPSSMFALRQRHTAWVAPATVTNCPAVPHVLLFSSRPDTDLAASTASLDDDSPEPHHTISDSPIEQPMDNLYNWNAMINTGFIVGVVGVLLYEITTMDATISRGWTSEELAARIPMDVWAGYSQVLENSPVATKAATSATVYTIGDFIAQRTQGAAMGDLDRGRIVRSMLAGLIGHGPLSHFWYNVCDHFFDNVLHWTAWWSFFPKVVVDQTTWGPIWNNTYILLLGLMKLEKLETIWSDMKRTTVPLILSGLKLWPLAHCVTYGLVPVENRLLWVDAVEILWVTILATTAAEAHADAKVDTKGEPVEETTVAATDASQK